MRRKRRVKKQARVALIDGDIQAFHMVTSRDFLREEHNADDEYWEVLDMKGCKEEFEARIQELTGLCGAEESIIFFGARGNFRKMLEPTYKGNRAKKKPLGYHAFVDWVRENFTCISIDELEADDVMGIYHTTDHLVPGETVVVSNDKDMRTLPGLLFVPEISKKPERVSEVDALQKWLKQTLTGDTADGYKGCPSIGEVKAEALLPQEMVEEALETCGSFDEAATQLFDGVIVPQFMMKGLDKDHALLQARLARILREGDYDVEDPEAQIKLWGDGGKASAMSSKARGRKRRKRRV